MAVRIETQAEPLPGYKLMERLGGGGFGEVWKCEAPGGLHKAIKFVFGSLDLAGDAGQRAEQELKALKRVMTVRHPYILSLERFDIIDGQLLIVMELADRNLWDRYKECRAQGLGGIPRDELLNYMEETAEALDLMNIHYQLQHLDIKPQNLFLVHNHIKVADFGLVKDLEGSQASVTGGITPVYAAPETFDGKVSRYSDQYSFGIVYQEMLCGVRPFTGNNVRQLIMQHLSAQPDLSPLPEADRPAIARALSKESNERFPTCRDLVRALRGATGPRPSVGGQPEDLEAGGPMPGEEEVQTVREASAQRTPPSHGDNRDGRKGEAEPEIGPDGSPLAPDGARLDFGSPRARDSTPTQCIRGPSGQGDLRRPDPPPLPADDPSAIRASAAGTVVFSDADETEGDGALVPTLVIGLGGLGAAVLQSLRTALGERFGSPDALPNLRLLLIDTDPDILRLATTGFRGVGPGGRAPGAGGSSFQTPDAFLLTADHVLLTPLNRPSYYLRPRDGRAPVEAWLNQRVLYRIPREQVTTGVRALGRLAFCDNFRLIQRRLHAELEACRDPVRLKAAADQTGLGVRSSRPRIVLVAGLMGGTGSGMFLDVAYAVRHLLRRLGYSQPDVNGLFFVPQLDNRVSRQGRPGNSAGPAPATAPARVVPLGNACAALAELSHYGGPGVTFSAHYLEHEPPVTDRNPPFGRTVLLPIPEETRVRTAHEAIGTAARYLLADSCSTLRRWVDKGKVGLPIPPPARRGQYFQTFGLYRLTFPRRPVVRRVAGELLQRIVARWMSKDRAAVEDVVRAWVADQWRTREMGAEHFIARIQQAVEKRLGKAPEAGFTAAADILFTPSGDRPPASGHKSAARKMAAGLDLEKLAEVIHRYEGLLGLPESADDPNVGSNAAETGTLAQVLHETSERIAVEWSQKLAELPVRLIEQPAFRLAGAEEAVRALVACIQHVLQTHEPLARDLADQATTTFSRLMAFFAQATGATGERRRDVPTSAEQVLELVRTYPKLRYQALVLQQVLGLYISLRGHLTDTLREINFCRVRLMELSQTLAEGEEPAVKSQEPAGRGSSGRTSGPKGGYDVEVEGPGKYLFPGDWQDTDQAVEGALAELCAPPPAPPSIADAPVRAEGSAAAGQAQPAASPPDAQTELDERIQRMIRRQFVAMVQVCTASANVTRNVARAMRDVAESFVEERLSRTDVAALFLARHPAEETANQVVTLYEEAVPEPARTAQARAIGAQSEVVVLTTPPGPSGERFRDIAQEALPDVALVTSSWQRGDDVLLYREWSNLALTDLEHLGAVGQQAYRQMLGADFPPHARQDVPFEIPL